MPTVPAGLSAVLLALALVAGDASAQGWRERLQQARQASCEPATQPPQLPAETFVLVQ